MHKEVIFIGLGRMGSAMTARLAEEGFTVHGFDVNADARAAAQENGIKVYENITQTIAAMPDRKVVWMMVPAKHVDTVLEEVSANLSSEDIIIDGGNTFFKDTIKRASTMQEKGIYYLDCGTSGGVDGARNGASLMVGGPTDIVHDVEEIFRTLATENGYGHVGNTGAGHFVKMVHNGIEYGMMGAIAEGMSFIESHAEDLNIDTKETLKPYEHGSIISSNLIGWLSEAYNDDGYLDKIAGEVPKGETEMEMEYIVAQNHTPVLQSALQQRKDTRENPSRTGTLISAMRNVFGGHKTIEK